MKTKYQNMRVLGNFTALLIHNDVPKHLLNPKHGKCSLEKKGLEFQARKNKTENLPRIRGKYFRA